MGVTEIRTLADFEKALANAGDKLVVVDFYADWCGPCKMIAPKIAEFSNKFTDAVFLKVNVDENDETAEKYGIKAMPTFKFFKKSQEVAEVVGASEAKIKSTIEEKL